MLSDNPPISLTAELTELLSVSSGISTALGKMFTPSTASLHENTTGVEKPPSPVTEGPPLKRRRHFLPVIPLLPPSPERKQKRKDSHAPF